VATYKTLYTKGETMLSTIVNCDVLKLVSIDFSQMLYLFIITSLFLPHPVINLQQNFIHFGVSKSMIF
jgi:hypothetical protein